MLNFIYNFIYDMINLLPTLSLEIPEDVKSAFFDIIRGATYFFPIQLCLPIIYCSLALLGFRMSLAIYKFVKSHIPI